MNLIQALLRRLFAQHSVAAGKSPTPLQPEHFKAVSGGVDESPKNIW